MIFYVLGTLGTIWCLIWSILASSYPDQHPYISQDEKEFIKSSLNSSNQDGEKIKTPWRDIFTSMPM